MKISRSLLGTKLLKRGLPLRAEGYTQKHGDVLGVLELFYKVLHVSGLDIASGEIGEILHLLGESLAIGWRLCGQPAKNSVYYWRKVGD